MKEVWSIKWSDDLLTGFEDIDNHHKKLLDLVNAIYTCCTTVGSTQEELLDLINKLKSCFREHFILEEEVFSKYGVSGAEVQKKDHENYKKLMNKADEQDGSLLVQAVLLNQAVILYFTKHLEALDRLSIKDLKEKLKNP